MQTKSIAHVETATIENEIWIILAGSTCVGLMHKGESNTRSFHARMGR